MTIRGGGNPNTAMAAMPLGEWTRRLGALPAEAYDCFMVGVPLDPTDYKRVARFIAHIGRLPSDHQSNRTRSLQRAAVLGRVKAEPDGGPQGRPSLDTTCARRRQHPSVGARESLRRGRTRERPQESEERKRRSCCGPLDKKSPIQAVCLNRARTDLSGGRGVTCVPTASAPSMGID
jgi:hypothetical protein